MAVELCNSDNSSSSSSNTGVMSSPRISFSYDLCQSDVVEQNHQQHNHHVVVKSSSRSMDEFDFCVRESFEQESSSADELFSHGKMIPTEIILKKKQQSFHHQPKQSDHYQCPPFLAEADHHPRDQHRNPSSKGKESKMKMISNEGDDHEKGLKSAASSSSFWGFKRSSSCGSGYGRSLCPLPLLSRSNSTGSSSSSNVKRSPHFSKDQAHINHNKYNSQKYSSSSSRRKPPLKKGQYGSSYGNNNAAPFNPVLNVPAANLFGFGLIFSNGKDKTITKKK